MSASSNVVFLKDGQRDFLDRMITTRMKAIRRRYKARIQADWYDMNEGQIDAKLCEVDREFSMLSDIWQKLYEHQ